MNALGNIIWLIFGGFFSAMGYIAGGIALCLTIIGIPFGLQCFKLALVMFWPFGQKVISNPQAVGCFSVPANIIWLICGGWWVALNHLFFGLLLCITIVGLPFGRQHFKMIPISLMPFGKTIV